MEKRIFYVYGHKLDGKTVYIGKGSKNRAWNFCQRSKLWNLTFKDKRPEVDILAENLTEYEALEREIHEISRYLKMGHDLINIAAGGVSGWDKRASLMLSKMRKGKKHPLYGTKRSSETIRKMLETKTERNNFAKPWFGKKRDPELMKRVTAASMTPEAREKSRLAKLGTKLSDEHKAKIRNSVPKKPVRCLETGKIYESAYQAFRETGIPSNRICEVCQGKRKSVKQTKWEYI